MRYEPFIPPLLTASLVMLGGCGGASESECLRQLSGDVGETRHRAAARLGRVGSWLSVRPLLTTLATDAESDCQLESACLEALKAIFRAHVEKGLRASDARARKVFLGAKLRPDRTSD